MKKIVSFILICFSVSSYAQEFTSTMATAKSAYASGDLSNARYAMEQLLQNLDIAIGKEIIKLLPTKLDALNTNSKEDNVSGNGGGVGSGLFITRTYGVDSKMARIEIINNSPLITSINAYLAIPFLANSSDGSQKSVKVQGYKSILRKNTDSETGKTDYELQVPMNNTLLTLKVDDCTDADILRMANTIPLSKISQMAQ